MNKLDFTGHNIVLIDHRDYGNGTIFEAWLADIELQVQDNGQTLKIIVRETESNEKKEVHQ